MSESIWPTIHSERAALIADVAELTPEQWATQSLCSEWDVHEVLAHQLSAAKMTPPKFLVRFGGAGFNFNKFAGRQVALESAGGPAATLAAFQEAQLRTSAPPGPKDTWLGEAFVHGEDIRRPLGISRDYPCRRWRERWLSTQGATRSSAEKTRWPGLTLRATDTDFTVGSGPLVEGAAISLLLAASGRKSALEELSGPGVETLRERA